jgi:hypothetical protein
MPVDERFCATGLQVEKNGGEISDIAVVPLRASLNMKYAYPLFDADAPVHRQARLTAIQIRFAQAEKPMRTLCWLETRTVRFQLWRYSAVGTR